MSDTRITFFIAIVLLGAASTSDAQAGLLGVSVKGGIDRKTRDFLNTYPEKVREETVLLLEQALPLIDKSVDRTFDRVDESVNSALAQTRCLMAVAPVQVDDATQRLIDKIKGKPSGNTMATGLSDFAEAQREKINGDVAPDKAAQRYANILASIYGIKCAFKDAAPQFQDIIAQTTKEYYASSSLWIHAMNLNCPDADACYHLKYNNISSYLSLADERDRTATEANARLAKLLPASSRLGSEGYEPSRISELTSKKVTLKAYEASFKELRAIEIDLASASLVRAATALAQIDQVEATLNDTERQYKQIKLGYDSRTPAVITESVIGSPGGPTKIDTLIAQIRAVNPNPALGISDSDDVVAAIAKVVKRRDDGLANAEALKNGYDGRIAAEEKRLSEEEAARAAAQDKILTGKSNSPSVRR